MWVWGLVMVFGITQGQIRLDPFAQTPIGLIRGLRANDGDYAMFLGIPFAQVNHDNPFGRSTPYPKFEDTFDAYDDSVVCPQMENNVAVGELDCLNLNVYVPNKASSRNRLPVLVWIHGGSLATASGNRYLFGPKYLVQHDVILVTMNYRLGPYGFFCLDIPEVPGNQGVMDQTLAMRWVRDNIASFGGDTNKITLMGESAGASSLEYHLYSKEERLYNQAIIQSGSVFTGWARKDADQSAPSRIAGRLGFITDDLLEALDFLKGLDPKLVIAANYELGSLYRVCVEKEFDGVESFLTDYPLNMDIPKIKNIPILSGFNARELLGVYSNQPVSSFNNFSVFSDSLRTVFNYDEDFEEMVDMVRHFYIGDEEVGENVKERVTDFRSDFYLNHPVQKSLKKFLENNVRDVFQYMFSYSGSRNYFKNKLNVTEYGAIHADEIGYLFDFYQKDTPTQEDQKVIDRITKLWTNFVKYGDPTPEITELLPVKWIPIRKDTINYLDIDKELTMKKRPYYDRVTFWELLYKANEEKLKGYRGN